MEAIIGFFSSISHSPIFLLTLTVVTYASAQMLYARWHNLLFNPILLSSAIVIAVLKLTGVEFKAYYEANQLLNFMLGFSVVSLGYLMHQNFEHIRQLKFSILLSTFVGSIIGVGSVIAMAYLLECDATVSASLQPKSVTMPIALSLSGIGLGIPALTSLAVIIAGVFGNIVGPTVLKIVGVRDPVARGLALGSSAHAVGTARAMELGAIEGAVSGAAIGLMGIMTSIVMPLLNKIL